MAAENELRLRKITLEDPNLVENDLCSRMNGKSGLTLGRNEICLLPDTYMPNAKFASHTLLAKEFLQMLSRVQFCIASDTDTECHEIPKVAQRVPTSDRRKGIRQAWEDPSRTPTNKVETFEVSVFNASVTPSKGVVLTDEVLLMLIDGGGRVSAAIEELAGIYEREGEIAEHIMVKRNIVIQLNLDLSGDITKAIKSFLAHNRDAKKITQGTTLAVENGLLAMLGDDVELTWDNPLSRTWIVNELYEKFRIDGSVVKLLPWQFEGVKTSNRSFEGRGNAASILTTLKDLEKQGDLKKSGLSVSKMPEAIDFAFRCWHKMCPISRRDAENDNQFHFASTLGLKVMLSTGIRVYAVCGPDEKKFIKMIEDVIADHFKNQKTNEYRNAKSKKMTPDKFWTQSKQFADPSTFNSGAKNTQKVVSQLRVSVETVINSTQFGAKNAQRRLAI